MDSRDRAVEPPYRLVTVYARGIPAELKYLISRYQQRKRLASFSLAVRNLLETHPDLAAIAAELYAKNMSPDGSDNPQDGNLKGDRRTPSLASLFLG